EGFGVRRGWGWEGCEGEQVSMEDKSDEVDKAGNVTGEQVVKEKQSDTTTLNVENTGLNSYPPLPMMGSSPPCNPPGKSSYANVTGKPSGKKLNFHTLFTPGGSMNGLDAMLENGISVGQKMGFKPKQVFQPVSKKSTANTCGKKKNNLETTKEVSKLNHFEVLTSVDNDVDLGTNEGISNSADKGTGNVSSSNTLIGEKIDKIERQICE
nr:hypothetical protein [Tanacetum cinerariifolium]